MAHLVADSGMDKGQLLACIEAIVSRFNPLRYSFIPLRCFFIPLRCLFIPLRCNIFVII